MDHSEVKHLPKVDHAPAELDEASKLLMRAADYMAAHGMCKGHVMDGLGRVCIGGAMIEAGRSVDSECFREAWNRIEAAVGTYMTTYNDAEERTEDEVVAKMRSVALGL